MSYNKIGDFMKKEFINVKFGNNLRKIREEHGYNQYDFAVDCQISEAYYGRIERGEHSTTILMAFKIAKQLGIPLVDLFKEIDKEK